MSPYYPLFHGKKMFWASMYHVKGTVLGTKDANCKLENTASFLKNEYTFPGKRLEDTSNSWWKHRITRLRLRMREMRVREREGESLLTIAEKQQIS